MENSAPQSTPTLTENKQPETFAMPETLAQPLIPSKKKKTHAFLPKTWQKLLFIFLVLLVAGLAAVGVYTFQVARKMVAELRSAQTIAAEAKYLLSTQNFLALPEKITALEESKNRIEADYQRLAFYGKVPFLKNYYQDGEKASQAADHAFAAAQEGVEAILPYADLLGFAGEGSFTGGTTQERVVLILDTLKEIQPSIDRIDQEIQSASQLLNQIDAKRYPESIKGIALRSQITDIQKMLSSSSQMLTDYKPVLAQLGTMAGAESPQKYLVLFQNDNELRPTGGFLTAYAIINIDKGIVTSEKSDDIYELDQKFSKKIAIPEELGRYLTTETRFHLRDMNISPDFQTSMETFYSYYQTVPGEPDNINGIIAVDTAVLTDLLRIIGPVEVPGYGTFSAENDIHCDCPQVVYALSEIITRPTPYMKEDRKGVLGPLMKSVLEKTYDLDKARFPELLEMGFANIKGRHVQAYFMDEASQKAAEQINLAGRLYTAYENTNSWQMGQNLDFLAIIDANLGGAKSNLFTNYEVEQTVSAPVDGFIEKTVEITYKNSRKADNCNLEAGLLCLNSTLNDWIRLYVPKGAELVEMQGLTQEAKVYDEEAYTVFDGYFTLEPLGLAKIKVTYKVPYSDQTNYNLKMWKQAGIDAVPVLIDVTGGEEQFTLEGDQVYSTLF
jgi:hypothetical protein